jgi:pSer/pThr/pTyr-binding forkhead associated (FHA) protein
MAQLVCTCGNDEGRIFSLKEGANRIGRAPDAAVRLNDKSCSRNHAEVFRKGDYISIEDRGSRHGIFINGRRATHRLKLQLGDRIDLGHTVLALVEGEAQVSSRGTADLPSAASQTSTQELSEQLLAAGMELRIRSRQPRISLLRRLFGDKGSNEKPD